MQGRVHPVIVLHQRPAAFIGDGPGAGRRGKRCEGKPCSKVSRGHDAGPLSEVDPTSAQDQAFGGRGSGTRVREAVRASSGKSGAWANTNTLAWGNAGDGRAVSTAGQQQLASVSGWSGAAGSGAAILSQWAWASAGAAASAGWRSMPHGPACADRPLAAISQKPRHRRRARFSIRAENGPSPASGQCSRYCAVQPPSIESSAPLIEFAAGEHRNAANPAT